MSQFEKEDEYIIDESREVSLGEVEGWTGKIFSVFPAFQSRNYQFYSGGQLISLVGTWLQMVAQSWLVLQLTNSPFLVGLVAAMGSLPTLVFALFGGVIVDRFDKRKILIFTQIVSMILALLMGFLTVFKMINVVEIIIFAFLLGLVTALDLPARQAFMVELVDRERLSSAIALNSGMFNGARVIGPSLAGFLIAALGIGGAFIINGLSFIAAIITLFLISAQSVVRKTHPNPFRAIHEGLVYAFTHPAIKVLLIFTAISAVFGWSYATVLPVMARDEFGLDVTGLGYLYAASGLGALGAAIAVSAFSKKINPLVLILGGNLLFTISLIIFALSANVWLAGFFLFLAGMGLIAQFSMINTAIQHLVDDKVRGRVMSIYTLMFLGFTPFGSFEIGLLAEHFGSRFAIISGAVVVLAASLLILLSKENIEKSFKEHGLWQKP